MSIARVVLYLVLVMVTRDAVAVHGHGGVAVLEHWAEDARLTSRRILFDAFRARSAPTGG